MKKKFTFFFPMSGETITKEFNLLAVKDATVKYLRKQVGSSWGHLSCV